MRDYLLATDVPLLGMTIMNIQDIIDMRLGELKAYRNNTDN